MGGILYHFTTIEGMQSILEGDGEKMCFRATSARDLNDPQEYIYALKILGGSLGKYEKLRYPETARSKREISELVNKIIKINYAYALGKPYILSFSHEPENLSLWRAYANDGKGVAIGLNHPKLKEYENNNNNCFLTMCDYNGINSKHIAEFWKKYYPYFDPNDRKHYGNLCDGDGQPLFAIYRLCFSHKDVPYHVEKEYRLCTIPSSACEYPLGQRMNNCGNIRSYCVHKFDKEYLSEIIIGPSTKTKIVKGCIRNFLSEKGYPDTPIRISKISYKQV